MRPRHSHGLLHRRQPQGLQLRLGIQEAVAQARDGRDGACGHVDEQLVPDRAHDVLAHQGVQARRIEHVRDALHALGQGAAQLAHVRVLAPVARDHMPLAQRAAAHVSAAHQHPLAAHMAGQDVFMAHAVLQGEHTGLWAQQCQRLRHGFIGVKRLDQHHHQVHRAHLVGPHGGLDGHAAIHLAHTHEQTVLAQVRHARLMAVDQPDLLAGLGQHAAYDATERARTQNGDFHEHSGE